MFLIVSCALFLGSLVMSGASCPFYVMDQVHWQLLQVYGDWCYFFGVFERKDYDQAREFCLLLGGTLAMPKTKDVNDFLTKQLTDTYFNKELPVWIGLRDREEEGEYRWEDGSYLQWNNFHFISGWWFPMLENCIALDPKWGTWDDYHCTMSILHVSARKPFICQFEAEIYNTENRADADEDKTDLKKVVNGGDENKFWKVDQDTDKMENKPEAGDKDVGNKTTNISQDIDAQKPIKHDGDMHSLKSGGQDVTKGEESIKLYAHSDTKPSDNVSVEVTSCPPFVCPGLNCGMRGFKYTNKGCQLCECNV